jgi:DNA-binding transcriptional LysR family regulator
MTSTSPDDPSFTALASLPPYACFAADHPLAAADSVTVEQLAAEPLVLLDLAHSREYFRALFSAAGVEPHIAHRSVHPDVIRTMVANGFGYTIFNARAGTDVARSLGSCRAPTLTRFASREPPLRQSRFTTVERPANVRRNSRRPYGADPPGSSSIAAQEEGAG